MPMNERDLQARDARRDIGAELLEAVRAVKAGKFGTFVICLGLGVGFVGYIAKIIIQWWIESH